MRDEFRPIDHEHLRWCMQQMAAGDQAFAFTFIDSFGERVEVVVRRILSDLGRRDLLGKTDELSSLVVDACLVIADKAAGWQPDGGALPWNWAKRAIRSSIARTIDQQAAASEEDFECDAEAGGETGYDVTPETWARLAAANKQLGLLDEALTTVASERDRWLFIEYLTQQGGGDPSPALTVGTIYGLQAANVRQIVRRQRQRLAKQAETDARFASLRSLKGLETTS